MKRNNNYSSIWSYSPSSMLAVAKMDKEFKEVILTNEDLLSLGVSEMDLHVKKITIIDSSGQEHTLINFKNQAHLNIQGIGSDPFFKLKRTNGLKSNTYAGIRFYLEGQDNRFIFKDGKSEQKKLLKTLNFDIENLLVINEEDDFSQFKIWFEMVPFNLKNYFKPIIRWFETLVNLKASIQGM